MKSKKIISVIASLCVMFSCLLAFGQNVFALTGEEKQTVTISEFKAAENTTVKIYKVGNVELDGGKVAIDSLSWVDDVKNWMNSTYPDYIDKNGLITKSFQNLTDKNTIDKFWQDMEDDILKNELILTPVVNKTVQSTSIREELGMGVYLLSITAPETIYHTVSFNVFPELVGDDYQLSQFSQVSVKKQDINIDKEITDDNFTTPSSENETVGVGSIIPYKVTTKIPTYEVNTVEDSVLFQISDTMQKGLKFNNDIHVYSDSALSKELELNQDYIITSQTDKGFELKLQWSYLNAHPNGDIFVTYTATVTDEAIDMTSIPNEVKLSYSNKQGISEKHDVEKAYTYNISFKKINKSEVLLKNATFELINSSTNQPIKVSKKSDGTYVVNPQSNDTSITSSTGNFSIKGLDTGNYVLKETVAPSGGYVLPQGSVTITLVDNEPDGQLDNGTKAVGVGIEISSDSTYNGLNLSFKVINKKADDLKLPVTGGIGTLIFTVCGASIMAVAVLLYVSDRKKRKI